jgi:hypothetical protein
MVQQKKKLNQKQLQLLQQLNTDEDLAKLWKVLISDAIDNALFEEMPTEEVNIEKAMSKQDEQIATNLSMALSMRSVKNKISKKQKKQLQALAKESSAATLWRVLFSSSFLSVLCDDYTGIPLPSVPTTGSDISEMSGTSRALVAAISSHANALVPAASNVSTDYRGIKTSTSKAASIIAPSRSSVSAGSRGVVISEDPISLVASHSHASNGGILKSISSHASVEQKEIIADALNNDEEFQKLWETAVKETLPKMLEEEYDLTAKSYVDFHPQVKEAVEEAQENMGDYRMHEEDLMHQEAELGGQLAKEAADKTDAAALRITDVFKVNKAKKQRIKLKEQKVIATRQLQSISEAVERAQADDEERQGDEGFVEIMDYKTRTVLMWSNRKAPEEEEEEDDADNTEVVIVRKGGKGKKKNKKTGVSEDSQDIKKSSSKKSDLKNTSKTGSLVETSDGSPTDIINKAASKQASIGGSMSNLGKSASKSGVFDEELVDTEDKGARFKLKKRSFVLGIKSNKSKAE